MKYLLYFRIICINYYLYLSKQKKNENKKKRKKNQMWKIM